MAKNLLWCVLALGLAAGCADAPQTNTDSSAEKGEVITGSNIPRKRNNLPNGVQTVGKDEAARAVNGIVTQPPSNSR